MNVFSLGLARVPLPVALQALGRRREAEKVPGMVHSESLMRMRLGAPMISPGRMQVRNLVHFAAWESEDAIEEFLHTSRLGQAIAAGWHLRMTFLRRWGSVRELATLEDAAEQLDPEAPVAAFTLARMKLPELPRFVKWGRPVECLVRDDPQSTFSLAAIRYPQTVATFSIWNSQQAMVNMVRGHSEITDPRRHIEAMKERQRRDFHHEFTTLRFRPISEFGSWEGRASLLPEGALG